MSKTRGALQNSNIDSVAAVLRVESGACGIRISRCYVENLGASWDYCWTAHLGHDVDATFVACGLRVNSNGTRSCIKLTDASGQVSLVVSNCVLLNGPIWGGVVTGVIAVRHCLVWDPAAWGVIRDSNAGGTVKNTFLVTQLSAQFFQNAPNFVASYCATQGVIPAGSGNIAGNAETNLVYWSDNHFRSDYHLSTFSALRDAGDPITPPDLDGSRADIGVYGGQTPYVYFGLPDIPIVTALEVPVSVPQNGVLHIGSRGRVGQGGGE